MELILISDSKLKVSLTATDMQRYDLKQDQMDYDNTETRRAFWQILDEAKHQTGFDAASDKVLIQVYPSRGGGCEMYVTKLGSARGGSEARCAGQSVLLSEGMYAMYRFRELSDVITVCRRLRSMGYAMKSSLYLSEAGGYDLLLCEEKSSCVQGSLHPHSFIEEYAEYRHGTLELAYIKEHGTCIKDTDAVETFANL